MHLDGSLKSDGKIYCIHGGDHHKSWWILDKEKNMFLQSIDGSRSGIEYYFVNVCIYIKNINRDMEVMKKEFLTYIGGQIKIQCYVHKLPLIVSRKTDGKCYQEGFKRKISLKCPELMCKSGICMMCHDSFVKDDLDTIDPTMLCDNDINTSSGSDDSCSSDSDGRDLSQEK